MMFTFKSHFYPDTQSCPGLGFEVSFALNSFNAKSFLSKIFNFTSLPAQVGFLWERKGAAKLIKVAQYCDQQIVAEPGGSWMRGKECWPREKMKPLGEDFNCKRKPSTRKYLFLYFLPKEVKLHSIWILIKILFFEFLYTNGGFIGGKCRILFIKSLLVVTDLEEKLLQWIFYVLCQILQM